MGNVKVEIRVRQTALRPVRGRGLVLPLYVWKGEGVPAELAALDRRLGGLIKRLGTARALGAEPGSLSAAHGPESGGPLVAVSLGAARAPDELRDPEHAEAVRRALGAAARELAKLKVGRADVALPAAWKGTAGELLAAAAAEGLSLALYRFDRYRSVRDGGPRKIDLVAATSAQAASARRGATRAATSAQAAGLARDLANTPGADATPRALAAAARKVARSGRLTCRVLGPAEMKRLGMGCILGVAAGSAEPPALIVMEYGRRARGRETICLVGKGITFDSGGISLKPGEKMHEMKYDKSGACAVIAAMGAAARIKPALHVVGIAVCAENLPSGRAVKPGDVLRAADGKTVEVWNTDAEGRLVLADALCYARRFKPAAIIDLATLTGAVIVGLGHQCAGLLGTSGALIERIRAAGEATGERVWPLPLWPEYETEMKGKIADLKNIGDGRAGGTILGAAFLKAFVDDTPWAHLDIAGVAWDYKRSYVPEGASGFGARLLAELLRTWTPLAKG